MASSSSKVVVDVIALFGWLVTPIAICLALYVWSIFVFRGAYVHEVRRMAVIMVMRFFIGLVFQVIKTLPVGFCSKKVSRFVMADRGGRTGERRK